LTGALGAREALVPVERDEVEREAEDREDGVRVDEVPEAGLRGDALPEVRVRVGALDRLAISREYPWVAGIPGVTGVTRVAGPGHAVSPAFTLDMAALHTGFASKWLP